MGNQACCEGVEEPKVIHTSADVGGMEEPGQQLGLSDSRDAAWEKRLHGPLNWVAADAADRAAGRASRQQHAGRGAWFPTAAAGLSETIPTACFPTAACRSSSFPTAEVDGPPPCYNKYYQVRLDKKSGGGLGLDIDFLAERAILPIKTVYAGVAEEWNRTHPHATLDSGDSIVEVNGCSGDATLMLERCKNDDVLELGMRAHLTYEHLMADLQKLVEAKKCGPILIRSCWRDNGYVPPKGKKSFCFSTTAARSKDKGESKTGSSTGLLDVAEPLLSNIKGKYCPALISYADLLVLAANVSILQMGGPMIKTRFGRTDSTSSAAPPPHQGDGGDKRADHLGWIFSAKDLTDKDVVALLGAKCVGRCVGGLLRFDNSYFRELLASPQSPEMLESDMELLRQPKFRRLVEMYAAYQGTFYFDFAKSWAHLQERGCSGLREHL